MRDANYGSEKVRDFNSWYMGSKQERIFPKGSQSGMLSMRD
jgi:hypothetical protein